MQELATLLSKITRALVDATGSIPSYDQKQYELQIKAMERSIESLRSSASSKGKFSFKRKAAAGPSGPVASAPAAPPIPATPDLTLSATTTESSILSLTNREDEYITRISLPAHSQRTDLSISYLKGCVVDLLHDNQAEEPTASDSGHLKLSALHIRNITNCVILLPSIEGSALLHDVVNCILVLGCHQFRMHSSKKADIFLSIASNPIIEDCNDIRFTVYPSILAGPSPNIYQTLPNIQDFSHIRPTPSPHYSIMDERSKEAFETSFSSLRRGTSTSLEQLPVILSMIA
ncbi:hypothetical protein CVT24_008694 [Panaeolus cyanescens]|uniref:C-CAP/cofactor C-like domain-containing protein n=1 Tax=Panaeolus cyanescens TaxID=181874 RepID=A0A409VKJ8_9AGAR|nr:hypothetical protein CVT24_008694 [Panaeolus cyanescens]